MNILQNAERKLEYSRREIYAQVEADTWEALQYVYNNLTFDLLIIDYSL